MQLYISLKLTYEKDRLTAFHGFANLYAKHISASVQRDYLLGLWKDDMKFNLLWRVEPFPAFDLDARRLCRCWDSEILGTAHTKLHAPDSLSPGLLAQRRCQYSHSSACSEACFRARRLCRYGKQEAILGIDAPICGATCVDSQGDTNIAQLIQSEQDLTASIALPQYASDHYVSQLVNDMVKSTDPALTTSWTWASVGTGVKYWNDITPSRSDPKQSRATCNIVDVHSDDSRLKILVSGHLVPASLQYQDVPDSLSADPEYHHDISRYHVNIVGLNRSSDFPIFADRPLSLEGPRYVPNRSVVYLLHVTSNVYLILKEAWFFTVPLTERAFKKRVMDAKIREGCAMSRTRLESEAPKRPSPNSKSGSQQTRLGSESPKGKSPILKSGPRRLEKPDSTSQASVEDSNRDSSWSVDAQGDYRRESLDAEGIRHRETRDARGVYWCDSRDAQGNHWHETLDIKSNYWRFRVRTQSMGMADEHEPEIFYKSQSREPNATRHHQGDSQGAGEASKRRASSTGTANGPYYQNQRGLYDHDVRDRRILAEQPHLRHNRIHLTMINKKLADEKLADNNYYPSQWGRQPGESSARAMTEEELQWRQRLDDELVLVKQLSQVSIQDPSETRSPSGPSFMRIGILRLPEGRLDVLYNEFHWMESLEVFEELIPEHSIWNEC